MRYGQLRVLAGLLAIEQDIQIQRPGTPALFPDPSRSQLWVDKETFLPYRLLLPPPPGAGPLAGSLEFRYGSWQPEASFQYPRRIDVFANGTAVREIGNFGALNESIYPKVWPDILQPAVA